MRHNLLGLFAVAMALLPFGGGAGAAEDPSGATPLAPPPAAPRDIQGIWFTGPGDPHRGAVRPSENLPFTPAGLEIYNHRRAMNNAGKPLADPSSLCIPDGMPRAAIARTPFQVIQTPTEIAFVAEQLRQSRVIYMNVKHPPNLKPSYMGHSVGRWDGDTLVVDTVGLRESWANWDGAPISDQVHVIEHYKKIEAGQELENVITVEDPKYYTKPWTVRILYDWAPEAFLAEYVCEEGEDHLEPGWSWKTEKEGG